MVLYAFESALGKFVQTTANSADSLPPGVKAQIEQRVNSANPLTVQRIVEETYLGELIDLAVSLSVDRSEGLALTRLKELMTALDLFRIRNAVSHPNRPFHESYWYRMAALATDPAIDQIGLTGVKEAFRCALEGRVEAPPQGWLDQIAWRVPNNLPSNFDHAITGLVARTEEAKRLLKCLENPRNLSVAIVGPGGTGKTALCLDVLDKCLAEPRTLDWAEEIVYVSAKTEQLRREGIEPIENAVTSLDSVERAIAVALDQDSFDCQAEEVRSRRVLLCIDNLETLLRDHPKPFEDFVESLPPTWRVLVTSRISINGAKVLALGPVNEKGALKLARLYLAARGGTRLQDEHFTGLIGVCDRNPLAIRLAIDSYLAGTPLSEALKKTKEQIIEFSYKSLVDRLHPNASKVLECLFGSHAPLSRGQIGNLLDLSPDDVAEAVNALLQTSLVTREIDGTAERYALSSSVGDLLLRAPRDAEVRDEVYARLKKQRILLFDLEKAEAKDRLDEFHVSNDAPDHVRALVARISKNFTKRSHERRVQDLLDVRQTLGFDADESVLMRLEALLLEQLKDRWGAVEAARNAVGCNPQDFASRLTLAELLREAQQLDEALEQTQPLIDADLLADPGINGRNKGRLLRAHWLPAIWLKRYDGALQITENWRTKADMRPEYAALRVGALQRLAGEQECLSNSERSKALSEMLECFAEVFRLDGYLPHLVHQAFGALRRAIYLISRERVAEDTVLLCAEFIDVHLASLCATSVEYSLSDELVMHWVRVCRSREVGGECNPLSSERWSDLLANGETEDRALSGYGYERARITNIRAEKGFAFARLVDGSDDFYIHASAMDSGEFGGLKEGQLLQVLRDPATPANDQAWRAKHAMLE